MQFEYPHGFFEAISHSAILLDKSGRIVDWNSSATSLFGYSKKEVLGRSVNLVYGQNHPFLKIIQDQLPQSKKWQLDTDFIRKNGTKGICTSSITLVSEPGNPKILVLLLHQNITAHRGEMANVVEINKRQIQALSEYREIVYLAYGMLIKNYDAIEQVERNLRESELRFHLLAENATDMIARLTTDGTFLYLSPSCKALIGYNPEDLVDQNIYKLVHHDDQKKLRKAFNPRKRHINHNIVIYRLRRKDGDYRWFESNVRIIRDEDTHTIREVQTASRDVTERIQDKKARLRGQQLAHVFRLSTMEEMASGMAHEISQPLAAIVNYTQGCVRHIQKGNQDSPQLIEIMQKAVAQAERAGEVIHRLKNFFCKGQLVRTPCKINSVIRETTSFLRNNLNASKTKIDFQLAKELPLIFADKIQLQQVLLNLMQNAIEAMEEIHHRDRRIQIQTLPLDVKTVEITVSDSGPGFSKEIITKVFRPFFTTKAHGTGMGLAICRSIIEAHGGQFTINPNQHYQSWIRFTLPIN